MTTRTVKASLALLAVWLVGCPDLTLRASLGARATAKDLGFAIWRKNEKSRPAFLTSVSVGKCYDEYVENPTIYWWMHGSPVSKTHLAYGEQLDGWTVVVPPKPIEPGCVSVALNGFHLRLQVEADGTVSEIPIPKPKI